MCPYGQLNENWLELTDLARLGHDKLTLLAGWHTHTPVKLKNF